MMNRIANDPILTGSNPKADERLMQDVLTGDVAVSAAVEACRDARRLGVAVGVIHSATMLCRAATRAYEDGDTLTGDAFRIASQALTDRIDEIVKAAERR
jgi:hypothetical protein